MFKGLRLATRLSACRNFVRDIAPGNRADVKQGMPSCGCLKSLPLLMLRPFSKPNSDDSARGEDIAEDDTTLAAQPRQCLI